RVGGDHHARPSDESPLHLRIVKERGAGAVLHTHSIWNTILSNLHAADGGLAIEGYEMLKGLQGVTTHEHREWLPILENSQDLEALADRVGDTLKQHQDAHGYLETCGVNYERWEPAQPVAADAPAEEILRAYASEIDELKVRGGYVTADVIDVGPETPGLEEMLTKFNREHWHDEDEVRFII